MSGVFLGLLGLRERVVGSLRAGLVGDVLKKPHRSSSASKAATMRTGDTEECDVFFGLPTCTPTRGSRIHNRRKKAREHKREKYIQI